MQETFTTESEGVEPVPAREPKFKVVLIGGPADNVRPTLHRLDNEITVEAFGQTHIYRRKNAEQYTFVSTVQPETQPESDGDAELNTDQ